MRCQTTGSASCSQKSERGEKFVEKHSETEKKIQLVKSWKNIWCMDASVTGGSRFIFDDMASFRYGNCMVIF